MGQPRSEIDERVNLGVLFVLDVDCLLERLRCCGSSYLVFPPRVHSYSMSWASLLRIVLPPNKYDV